MDKRIGFIGLGVMGGPMAGHLMEAGLALCVYARDHRQASKLIQRGVKLLKSPAELTQQSDVIFLCVTESKDVQEIITGKRGIVEVARPGLVVVDHSTISPAITRQLSDELAAKGATLLDAPVSGGDVGARNGTLSIMVGGNFEAYERVEPLLRYMGSQITYCGESGTGQMTKLVNQILVSVTNLAVSEALIFAKKQGLDLERTIAAVGSGAAGSWQLSNLGPRMINGDLKPGFTIRLQQKDLKLVLQAAEDSQTSLPATSLVHQLFTAAEAAGHGKDGTQALFTVVEKLASLH